jgi:hypothetical protein
MPDPGWLEIMSVAGWRRLVINTLAVKLEYKG